MKKVVFGSAFALSMLLVSCGGNKIDKMADEYCKCYEDNDNMKDASACAKKVSDKYKDVAPKGDDKQSEAAKKAGEKISKCVTEATKKYQKDAEK